MTVSLAEWLETFRAMHEKARRGQLSGREVSAYRAGREELARALLVAQRLACKAGETPRQALRVARALQVDLDLPTSRLRAITVDISIGGFATLLIKAPPLGDEIGYSLRLPAADPLAGRARICDVKPHTGNVRVSFQFVKMGAEERERLEMFVFDAVLALLSG